jgi:inner membrane protein
MREAFFIRKGGTTLNYRTHSMTGALAMELILVETHAPVHWWTPVLIFASGLSATVPDIDHPESAVSHRVPLVGIIARFLKHRTVTHSLLAVVAVWALLVRFLYFDLPGGMPWDSLAWSMVIGYASHPFIDLFNPEGVQLFWPLPYWVRVLHEPLAIPVNSLREEIVCLIFKLAVVVIGVSYALVNLRFHIPFLDSFAWHVIKTITFGR